MNFYWRFKNIPELAELPAHKRTIVWHACKRLAWRHWQMWLGALVAALLGVSVCAGLLFALLPGQNTDCGPFS